MSHTGLAAFALSLVARGLLTLLDFRHIFWSRRALVPLLLVVAAGPAHGAQGGEPAGVSAWDQIAEDHRGFYSGASLLTLAAGVAVSGILAHTATDTEVRDFYQDRLRSPATDGVSEVFRLAGDVRLAVPLYMSGFLVGKAMPETPVGTMCGEWGERTMRALVVGGPPVLILENLLGSSEPEDGGGSDWQPFQDNAGVSGHAFLGAVTFLSAARMVEGAAAGGVLLAASALPALSRVNDDDHYLSQVSLGWLIGYLAVAAVDAVPNQAPSLTVLPGIVGGFPGVILTRAF